MKFQVKQEKFEGPLEALLGLIEKEKLSVSEISLAKITDEFLTYVRSLGKIDPVRSLARPVRSSVSNGASPNDLGEDTSNGVDPEELARFLVVAATLMLIKSRSLLPSLKFSEEEEESIEDLEKRLAEYQRVRELAGELKKLEARRAFIFTREEYMGMELVFYPPRKFSPKTLYDAYKAIIASIPKIEKLAEEKIKRIISLEEKVGHIRQALQGALERSFSELVKGAKEKVDVIVSFLAVLELARQKFVELEQGKPFEDITIKKL